MISVANSPARRLIAVIQEFARLGSNPVLELLAGESRLELERKYPTGDLRFGGARLRAFYHCHDAPEKDANEHGHFHLFVLYPGADDERLEDWSHLAALSMDGDGQPISWVAVNQWVTGGRWLEADAPAARLDDLHASGSMTLTERWLLAMVVCHREALKHLLYARDSRLREINAVRRGNDILVDREIYMLAKSPINLLARLEESVAGEAREARVTENLPGGWS